MSKMKRLELSKSKKSVHVGPGLSWGDVYRYLAEYGLFSIGGRIGNVGVPGLLLGGGLNYFTNKYGFAMDNVISYEVVLANGKVVQATATNEYCDLFWALKGGGSQFGIVTDFELRAFQIPTAWSSMSALVTMGPTDPSYTALYSAITNLANSGYEKLGAGVNALLYLPTTSQQSTPIGNVVALLHEGNEMNPAIFSEFSKLNTTSFPGVGTLGITRPGTLADIFASMPNPIPRYLFHAEASVATLAAIETMHEILFRMAPKLIASVPSLANAGVSVQPIPISAIEVGKSDPDRLKGNSFGLKSGEAQLWYTFSIGWGNPADDAAVDAWAKELGDTLENEFRAKEMLPNDGRSFRYMNDAQGGQDVFSAYGPKELKKLKEIREKYDPEGQVFGKNGLASGGFGF